MHDVMLCLQLDSMAARFAQTSEEEREKKRIDLNSKKTLKANKSAAMILKENITVRGEVENFEEFDAVKLHETLGRFYIDLRREDGSHYK